MKTILALVVLVGSTTAFANTFKGPYDTTDYNCYDLQKKINANGILALTVDGSAKVAFVADPAFGSYCSDGTETVFVKTADFKGCALNVCDQE